MGSPGKKREVRGKEHFWKGSEQAANLSCPAPAQLQTPCPGTCCLSPHRTREHKAGTETARDFWIKGECSFQQQRKSHPQSCFQQNRGKDLAKRHLPDKGRCARLLRLRAQPRLAAPRPTHVSPLHLGTQPRDLFTLAADIQTDQIRWLCQQNSNNVEKGDINRWYPGEICNYSSCLPAEALLWTQIFN